MTIIISVISTKGGNASQTVMASPCRGSRLSVRGEYHPPLRFARIMGIFAFFSATIRYAEVRLVLIIVFNEHCAYIHYSVRKSLVLKILVSAVD